MRATYFKKPLEFSIEIHGESWKQGDIVSGSINVVNHSSLEVDLSQYAVYLCIGDLKKIQKKDIKGIQILDECPLKEDLTEFSFKLDENCVITQKASGPYLILSKKGELLDGHQLALQVGPSELIANILEVIENYMRFKVKSLKPKNSALEAVITLPSTKEYIPISSFKLSLSKNEESLTLGYNFKIKKVSFEGGVTSTKDENKSFSSVLNPKDYLIYGSSLNQDAIVSIVNNVLDEVKFRPII